MTPAVARLLFVIIGAAAVALRCWKLHTAGIIHDEAVTYLLFGRGFTDALSRYPFANNHVLNSLAIHAASSVAGGYDHFIRLPAVGFAIGYVVLCGWLCRGFIRDRWLGLWTFAAVTFMWFPFDLSYLARGYSAALFTSVAALAIIGRAAAGRCRWWREPVWLGVVNVISLTSLLTTVYFVTASTAVFVAIVWWRGGEAGGSRLRAFLEAAWVTATVTITGTGCAYARILPEVLAVLREKNEEYAPLHTYLVQSFGNWFLYSLVGGPIVSWLISGVAIFMLLAVMIAAVGGIRGGGPDDDPAPWWFAVGGLHLLLLAAASYGAGASLGYVRNHCELPVLLALLFGIAADRLAASGVAGAVRSAWVSRCGCAMLAAWALGLMPQLTYVQAANWQAQSTIGPLVRDLRAIDGLRQWSIGFSPSVSWCTEIVDYYSGLPRPYRVRNATEEVDVAVLSVQDPPVGRLPAYRPEYFGRCGLRVHVVAPRERGE